MKNNFISKLSRPKVLKILSIIFIIAIISICILNHLIFFNAYNIKFLAFPLAFIILIPLFIISILSDKKPFILSIITIIIVLLVLFFITSSKIFNYKDYRNLAGDIKVNDFSKDVKIVDLTKLPIIDPDLAENLADKKLGEISSLGSTCSVGNLTLQNVNGNLYYVGPLEHSGFFKWNKNKSGTIGYIKVNATRENDVELVTEVEGKKLNLKYLDSAYFGSYLKRHAFYECPTEGLTDFSFEIDDDGNPYYVISIYEKSIGIKGNKVIGTLIIDPQTGESTRYSVSDTPKWVDRIQPESIINKNLDNWGTLVHGVFNFSNTDELKTTEGMSVIYNDDICYYYTGVTSVGADESLVGFFLTNSRTGETKMYKVSGAIESAGQKSAEGKVQQYEYVASFPILINIQNQPTYFMTLLDSKGLIKNFAFVSVKNYNVVGVGETINQASNNYIEALNRDGNMDLTNSGNLEVKSGRVERCGMFMSNNSTYYMIAFENDDRNYVVPTEIDSSVSLVKINDEVSVEFIPNQTNTVTVKSFKNNSR